MLRNAGNGASHISHQAGIKPGPQAIYPALHAQPGEVWRMKSEAVEAIKAVPPVTYIGTTLAGLTWGEWASIAALVYTCWLLAEKVWKLVGPRFKAWQAKRGL